jgi:hypothetical protein
MIAAEDKLNMDDGWILQFHTIRPDVTFQLFLRLELTLKIFLKSLIYVMDVVKYILKLVSHLYYIV